MTSTSENNEIDTGLDELLNVTVRAAQHQVDVERDADALPHGLDDGRAHAQVRHEVPVHDVKVQGIPAGGLRPAGLLRQMTHVSGEQRWKDQGAHGERVCQRRHTPRKAFVGPRAMPQ